MTEKDHKDTGTSGSEQSGEDTERLSKDEKLAFEKIISEIGQDQEAQAPSATEPESQTTDNLDDEQQAALDKIMAEINADDGDHPSVSEAEPVSDAAKAEPVPEPAETEPEPELEEAEPEPEAAEVEPESEATDTEPPSSDELDDEQQAALDKIMAEINAGDEEKAPEPESEPEPKAAEAQPESETSQVESPSSDELDDEQQAALDKIMAEINGGDEEKTTETVAEPEPEVVKPESEASDELDDEQQAALDKIMSEINGAGEEKATEPVAEPVAENDPETKPEAAESESQAPDELDDEQQAALDKIMAEINGDDEDKAPEPEAQPEPEAAESEPQPSDELDDEQQAALDKIMAEINGGDEDKAPEPEAQPEPEAAESEPQPSDDLNDAQQAALDKIMSEINGDDTENTTDPESEPQATSADAAPDTGTDTAVNDAPVEDSENETPSPETAQLSLEEFNEELNSLLAAANSDPESPSTEKAASTEETSETEKPIEDDPTPEETLDEKPAEDLNEKNESEEYAILHEVTVDEKQPPKPEKKKAKAKVSRTRKPVKRIIAYATAALAVILVGGGAYWYLETRGAQSSDPVQIPVAVLETTTAPVQPAPPSMVKPEAAARTNPVVSNPKPSGVPKNVASSGDVLAALKEDITSAREQVLAKMEEVKELKAYYENGIAEDQKKARSALDASRISSFNEARDHHQVGLSLRSIQRRKLYTTKLEVPIRQLTSASEELLFLKRKTIMFEALNRGLSGLAIPEFTQEVSTIIGNLLKLSDELSIDHIEMAAPSLEIIWKDLVSTKSLKAQSPIQIDSPQDREISKELCQNNFERKYLLKTISTETAKCLVKWSGKDLYLNGLTRLSPSQAKVIAQWPGEWLSLNGLKELSPDAAKHLSQWSGKRLSLNGLTKLSKRATQHLSQWNGEQLEMVGLETIGRWENYGTRLYLSEKLRRKLQVQ